MAAKGSKAKAPVLAELVRQDVEQLTSEIQSLYCSDSVPWIVGYSGGKDSTAVLQLVWNAISALPSNQRIKPIYVISTDTLVENPIISAWVRQSLEHMKLASQAGDLPFQPNPLNPKLEDTFWVNLIGKGYPAPRQKFRWCTERLKIHPANRFIRDVVRDSGETILVLGTRKAESQKRAATMAKHALGRVRDKLSPNASMPNSLIYTPIEDWSNDAVWLYLNQWKNPWGHSNKDLFQIYRGATADNECPLVVDTSTPSCGSSRFGCWVCTLVDRDKSMEAMILNDDSKGWMQSLLDFRDELDFRTDEKLERERENRDFRRITGNVQLFERTLDDSKEKEVTNVPGPYVKRWREYLLRRLLETQEEVRQKAPSEMADLELISAQELSEIRRIWLEEKHEFDDALPRIYREVTGEIFRDPRRNAGNAYLGADEWSILNEICDDSIHFQLMNRLLDTERQYQTMSRRTGLYKELETCCQINFAAKDEALDQAHDNRNLKQAAASGNVADVKKIVEKRESAKTKASQKSENGTVENGDRPSPLSWATLKFGNTQFAPPSPSKVEQEPAIAESSQDQTPKFKPTGIPHITLTELILENFGPYRGQHIIDLTPTSNNQPIILFGGMNGGGKTTLMDAIRLAFYGHRAPCSTRSTLSYGDFLNQCVNRQANGESTSIELAFQQTLNNAPQPTEFRVRRTWSQQLKNGRDRLEVLKDGFPDTALAKAWDERIEDLLPLGISSLFLFDGEQVKELAEQDDLPPLVTSAMRSLLGLELPDRLSADLDVLIGRKRKEMANQSDRQKLEDIETHLKELQDKKRAIKQQLAALQNNVDLAQKKLNNAEHAFLTQGGKIAAEQTHLESQLQDLQKQAETNRTALRDIAAGSLPLAMIQPLLNQAQEQVKEEIKYQQSQSAQDLLREHYSRLQEFLPALKLKPTQKSQFEAFLSQEQSHFTEPSVEQWLGATVEHSHQLAGLLSHGLPEQIRQAQKYLQDLQDCQIEIDAAERYLATAAAPEVYAKLKQKFQQAQAEVVRALAEHSQVEKQLEQVKQAIAKVNQELVDYTAQTIEEQTTENILNAAIRAQETLKEFKNRLKLRKLNQLEILVTECFLYLLHKSNLVHRIQIDTETFRLSLFDLEGQAIPKHRLSAGEKQLLAIALLWGLARASGRQLPIAIDTPLGRLDSEHRHNLIERYFPQASHQVLLLSTDTEIRAEDVKQLREAGAIAREYLLEYDSTKQQTQLKAGYFTFKPKRNSKNSLNP